MRALKVTAWLASPIAGGAELPLDGILLYYAMLLAHGGGVVAHTPGQTVEYEPEIVPLQIVRSAADATVWFYACSFAQWPAVLAEGVSHWNKRFDERMAGYIAEKDAARKVTVTKAHYKAYHMPIRYRHAEKVWWHCVGDADRISELLRYADFIGGKTAQGWGNVSRWLIEEAQEDFSIVDADMSPMRAIPQSVYLEMTNGMLPLSAVLSPLRGFRPPYWSRSNQGAVVSPDYV